MKRRITQRFVERLEAPAEGSRVEWDGQVPGFGVRITAAKVISFVLNYSIHGRERRYTIGRWPEWSADAARAEALELRRGIAEGKDPLHEKCSAEASAPFPIWRTSTWSAMRKFTSARALCGMIARC